jgi:hypothetical protein
MLRPGDYVKTGTHGSAEIMFTDGSLYTVRPDTLFLVSARTGGQEGDQSIELQYGWINLNTAQGGSKVATPQAEAVIGNESEAVVTYDGDRQQGRFANYRGELRVAAGGEVVTLAPLEGVSQTRGKLSEVQVLPGAPQLVSPDDNTDVDIDTQKELALAWEAVPGGARYALQISRNRLFVDNVIDVADRRTTAATIGVRGEGAFVWRVAALAEGGERGPWSPVGRFRVAFRPRHRPRHRQHPGLRPRPRHRGRRALDRGRQPGHQPGRGGGRQGQGDARQARRATSWRSGR